MIEDLCKNPFRLFFPLAILCILYASGLWFCHGILGMGVFPLQKHVNLFLGGFLYFSILGFLLTAIPRFTQTYFLSRLELSLYSIIILLVIFFFFIGDQTFFWGSICFGWMIFIFSASDRFLQRKQNPPYTFLFVGGGVFFGLTGSFLLFWETFAPKILGSSAALGKLFFYDGMVTSFIIGVGGRLIPGIFGHVEIVKEQKKAYELPDSFLAVVPLKVLVSFALFIISYILDANDLQKIAFILRALIISFFAFKYWRLHEKVPSGKWHGKMIKLSCWSLFLASWGICFTETYIIHLKHMIYIGSFCLLTIMVSSRVILAHNNESLNSEFKKFPYLVVGGLIFFAALTRASAIFIPNSYLRHLGYAGLVLFIAIAIWVKFFGKKLIVLNSDK